MCFAPQRRALVRHLMFCTFWLPNVLRATCPCTFPTSQLPKVVQTWCDCAFWLQNVLRGTSACAFHTLWHIATSKVAQTWCGCAFWLPHVLGVCTFASLLWPAGSAPAALASLLIDPPQPQNIGKNIGKTLFATFLPFRAPASSLFWLSPCVIFSLLTFTLSQLLLKRLSLSIRSYCRKFSFQTSIDHFFMASTARNTHRMEQLQNTLVRGHQLCTQLSILDGSLAELLLFWSTSTLGEIL